MTSVARSALRLRAVAPRTSRWGLVIAHIALARVLGVLEGRGMAARRRSPRRATEVRMYPRSAAWRGRSLRVDQGGAFIAHVAVARVLGVLQARGMAARRRSALRAREVRMFPRSGGLARTVAARRSRQGLHCSRRGRPGTRRTRRTRRSTHGRPQAKCAARKRSQDVPQERARLGRVAARRSRWGRPLLTSRSPGWSAYSRVEAWPPAGEVRGAQPKSGCPQGAGLARWSLRGRPAR